MNRKKLKNSGITLIALVITIIVLLILAGVSIATLTGNNGLIQKTSDANDATKVAQEIEQLQIEVLGSYNLNGRIDLIKLKSNIISHLNATHDGKTSFPLTVTYTDTNNKYKVYEDGNVMNYKKANPTDVYAAVCANHVLVFSNNTADIEQYLSTNGTTIADGYEIENITDMEYDDGTETPPPWCNSSVEYAKFLNEVVPKSTAYWFKNCWDLKQIENISKLDTCNVTNMSYMFYEAYSLQELDVSGFDTSSCTDMSGMFGHYDSAAAYSTLDVSGFDTSKVTNMSWMFSGLGPDVVLDLRGFDTSNVTDMSFMFNGCFELKDLDLSNFNTSKVTNMEQMFCDCSIIESIDLSSFDTSNVTNMTNMFAYCSKLSTIYVGEKWDTNKVTDGYMMFYGCGSLVGGMGTVCSGGGVSYAHIDGGTSNPGYFTAK